MAWRKRPAEAGKEAKEDLEAIQKRTAKTFKSDNKAGVGRLSSQLSSQAGWNTELS